MLLSHWLKDWLKLSNLVNLNEALSLVEKLSLNVRIQPHLSARMPLLIGMKRSQ
jgi:hypothetical protein